MNGFAYARRKKGLMQKELADLAKVDLITIQKLESSRCPSVSVKKTLLVADALGVSLGELYKEYTNTGFSSTVVKGDFKVNFPKNILDIYRCEAKLQYPEISAILGITTQGACAACHRDLATPKHIKKLAAHLGITSEELLTKYGGCAV